MVPKLKESLVEDVLSKAEELIGDVPIGDVSSPAERGPMERFQMLPGLVASGDDFEDLEVLKVQPDKSVDVPPKAREVLKTLRS